MRRTGRGDFERGKTLTSVADHFMMMLMMKTLRCTRIDGRKTNLILTSQYVSKPIDSFIKSLNNWIFQYLL